VDAVDVLDQQRIAAESTDVFLAAQDQRRIAAIGLDVPGAGRGKGRYR
jgi:hypothetical protein